VTPCAVPAVLACVSGNQFPANELGQRRSDLHCYLRKLTFRKSGVPDGYFLTGWAGSRSGG